MNRWPLFSSFVLFIVLCASAAYWVIQFLKPAARAMAAPPQTAQAVPKPDAAAGMFGSHPSSAVSGNFQLKGVLVAGDPAESIAVLAASGKPARAVRTNQEVIPGVTVKEVQRGFVLLSENGAIKRVELPEKAKAQGATGISISPSSTVSPQATPPSQPNSSTPPAIVGDARKPEPLRRSKPRR